jgi:hypothetical protein
MRLMAALEVSEPQSNKDRKVKFDPRAVVMRALGALSTPHEDQADEEDADEEESLDRVSQDAIDAELGKQLIAILRALLKD